VKLNRFTTTGKGVKTKIFCICGHILSQKRAGTNSEVMKIMCINLNDQATSIMIFIPVINRLAPEFLLILAHPVHKMWRKQEPNTLEL